MGRKNVVFNDYISQKERFADFYNGTVFRGRQIIRPGDLTELDSKLWRRTAEKGSYHEYMRDIVKLWSYKGRHFVLGLEPEESLHFALPVKYMNYESIQYDTYCKKRMKEHRQKRDLSSEEYISGMARSDRLMPLITVGVYLGTKAWTAPERLYEMLGMEKLPPAIKDDIAAYCNDFHTNIVDINALETTDVFVTDIREVFGFLKHRNDRAALEKYINENKRFHHLKEDAYDVIAAYSDDRKLIIRKEEFKEREGFDMCLALQQIEERGIDRGRKEGFFLSIRNLMESTGMPAEQAMSVLKVPECEKSEYVHRLAAELRTQAGSVRC